MQAISNIITNSMQYRMAVHRFLVNTDSSNSHGGNSTGTHTDMGSHMDQASHISFSAATEAVAE